MPGVLNEKNGTRISKRGKKKRARNRSQTHHEKLRDRNNKSSMVKEWLENRNKKAIDRDEFYKYKNIQFHRINTYKKFDLIVEAIAKVQYSPPKSPAGGLNWTF